MEGRKYNEMSEMTFSTGVIIGIVFMFIIHLAATTSYKKILVMKAKDGTAEYINGKFYYIHEEGDEAVKSTKYQLLEADCNQLRNQSHVQLQLIKELRQENEQLKWELAIYKRLKPPTNL